MRKKIFSTIALLSMLAFFGGLAFSFGDSEDFLGRFAFPAKPDLTVSAFSVDEDSHLVIVEQNLSRVPVLDVASYTEVYIDDELVDSIEWYTLEGDGYLDSKATRVLSSELIQGLRKVTVCTDVAAVVDERNEENNCLTEDVAGLDVEYLDGFAVFPTTNADQGLEWFADDTYDARAEVDGPIYGIEGDHVLVLVPGGYEELGIAHAKDLEYCLDLIPTSYEMNYPDDKVNMKRYSNIYDVYRGSSVFGWLLYSRGLTGLDGDLEDILTGSDDGFLASLGPDNCSNAHEFTHALLNGAPVPSWAEEGIAEYTQKLFQADNHKEECGVSGAYFLDDPDEIIPYVDLSEELDYTTSMCMIEAIQDVYGWDAFLRIFDQIEAFQRGELESHEWVDYEFVENILVPALGADVYYFLQEWGIEPGDYAAL